MKRDMDLARKFLLDVEECGQTDGLGYLTITSEKHLRAGSGLSRQAARGGWSSRDS